MHPCFSSRTLPQGILHYRVFRKLATMSRMKSELQSSMIMIYILFISAFALFATLSANALTYSDVKRSDFPKDFVFGVSSAAAQVEGSTTAGGRGPSVWDEYVRKFPEKIMDKSTLGPATDSYKLYKEDVLTLKALGVDVHRFSVSWTRIFPDGTMKGGINQEGINYYNNLINELVYNGIKPFVTLLHFDSPQALEDKYGGFLNRSIVQDFKDYADVCFKTFGDRVKTWMTINGPLIITKFGYGLGMIPPARCSDRKMCAATEPYIATHNFLLAHATAVRLYIDKYQAAQGGQIGLSLVGQHFEPYSNSSLEMAAAERAMDFELGWYMEPLVRGKYPESMRKLVKDRLPVFTEEEENLVKGSFDFIGINYYTARYAKDIPFDPQVPPVSYLVDEYVDATVERDGVLIGPNCGGSAFIYAYPEGMYKLLKFMQTHYNENLPIYITENGVPEKKANELAVPPLNDQFRIEFIQKHLYQLRRAMK